MWGVVWDRGSHFVFYEGGFTKEKCVEVLTEGLLPLHRRLGSRTILYDMHPSHRANIVSQWFVDHKFPALLMPPHSPQFNAIEEGWAWIKHDVKTKHPFDKQQLKAACESAFKRLPLTHIQGFISHASRMIKEAAKPTA